MKRAPVQDSRVDALDEQLRQMDRLYRSATPEQQRTLRVNREKVRRQRQAIINARRNAGR